MAITIAILFNKINAVLMFYIKLIMNLEYPIRKECKTT